MDTDPSNPFCTLMKGREKYVSVEKSLGLSHEVLRALSTLRCLPVDILGRHLDVTGLAVNAAMTS